MISGGAPGERRVATRPPYEGSDLMYAAEHPSATDHNAFRTIRNQQVASSILVGSAIFKSIICESARCGHSNFCQQEFDELEYGPDRARAASSRIGKNG
jgi:hypothetical protein